jgi:biotin synthase
VTFLDDLADRAVGRIPPTREDALRILDGPDEPIAVVAAGSRVRRHFFGRRIKLNTIINMKSGLAPRTAATARNGSVRSRTS